MKKLYRKQKNLQSQRAVLRKLGLVFSFAAIAGAVLFVVNNIGSSEKARAYPGKDGSVTITSANTIVNEYTRLSSNASAGTTTISVTASSLNANGRFAASLAAGDLLLIIQMQGASISTNDNNTYGSISSYNSAGLFEYAKVASVPSGTSITLANGLKNSYAISGKVQVIRVPRYASLTVNSGASITCPAWDGNNGGIVALESASDVVLNGSINADGKGFRGGTVEQFTKTPGSPLLYRSTLNIDGAEKGESIAGLASALSNGRYGRGAPANGGGGGNAHNGGGGGGANVGSGTWTGTGNPDNSNAGWTTAWNLESAGFALSTSPGGGRGGYSWSSNSQNPLTTAPGHAGWGGDNRQNSGGLGGRILDPASATRIFMGGGGGAGDSNNGTGTAGGNGGGIVFILAKNNVSGTGSISASGSTPPNTSSCPTCYGDASGGGGGGGSVLIYTYSGSTGGISIDAIGGNGGSQNIITVSECESPGGGGGGGYVAITGLPALSINVSGGSQGSTDSPPMASFTPNGATRGGSGITYNLPPGFNPYSAGGSALPVVLRAFDVKAQGTGAFAEWETASEINNDYFVLERSWDGLSFEVLGRIHGAGTSTLPQRYNFSDDAPFPGTSYYRLTQVDYDGRSESFPVRAFNYTNTPGEMKILQAGPNPFSTELSLLLYLPEAGLLRSELLSARGHKIWESIQEAESGRQLFTLRPEVSAAGVYFLRLSNSKGKSVVTRLVKK